MGAGTFHFATFLRSSVRNLGVPSAGLPQADRRTVRRNPNRMQHYYQYQVVLKPAPADIQQLYLDSLKELGIDPKRHDIRFVQDDWESDARRLGPGLGSPARRDGNHSVHVLPGNSAHTAQPDHRRNHRGQTHRYGLYQVDNTDLTTNGVTYGDVHHRTEVEFSRYNFEEGDVLR
ncbi:MAG: glycine--tRNA ligase subunit alpha [Nitrospiraceae bacterium]